MRKTCAALALLSLVSPQAFAGYDDSSKEFEDYAPPAWLFEAAPATSSPAVPVPVPRVEAAPLASPEVRPFFTPDEAGFKLLTGLAKDGQALEKRLAEKTSLKDLEILALSGNPLLAAKAREVEAARNSLSITRALNENLKSYQSYTASSMPEAGGVMKEPASYPYPGVGSLRSNVALLEEARAREELEAAKAEILTKVRLAYWELAYVEKAAETVAKTLAVMENLASAVGSRYSAGEGMLGEVAAMKIEIEKMREEEVSLGLERKMWEANLSALLALPASTGFGPVDGVAAPPANLPGLEVLRAAARSENLGVRSMKRNIARMEEMLSMSEAMTFARPEQGLSTFDNNPAAQAGSMAMEDAFPLSATASEGVGTPKRVGFSADNAYVIQTRNRLAAERELLKAEEFTLDGMVREAWTGFDAARRGEALYRERVGALAEFAFDAGVRTYQAGTASFSFVLDSYRVWLGASLERERNYAQMGKAAAELEKLTGRSPLAATSADIAGGK